MGSDTTYYETYEDFLRVVICRYWESGYAQKANFLSLLLACRAAWSVAWDKTVSRESGRRVLKGAAGTAAAAVLIRALVGGPIGMLLGAASIASLVAVYVKNYERIWAQAERYRELIEGYRPEHERVWGEHAAGKIRDDQRDLMMDGLVSRFLEDLDTTLDSAEEPPQAPSPALDSFAAHVARRETEGSQRD